MNINPYLIICLILTLEQIKENDEFLRTFLGYLYFWDVFSNTTHEKV